MEFNEIHIKQNNIWFLEKFQQEGYAHFSVVDTPGDKGRSTTYRERRFNE